MLDFGGRFGGVLLLPLRLAQLADGCLDGRGRNQDTGRQSGQFVDLAGPVNRPGHAARWQFSRGGLPPLEAVGVARDIGHVAFRIGRDLAHPPHRRAVVAAVCAANRGVLQKDSKSAHDLLFLFSGMGLIFIIAYYLQKCNILPKITTSVLTFYKKCANMKIVDVWKYVNSDEAPLLALSVHHLYERKVKHAK